MPTRETPIDLAATPDWQNHLRLLPLALIYKHSPACALSFMAAGEVGQFVQANPDVPVYVVDVIRDRPFSRRLSVALGTAHASPQVLLLRHGIPVWTASHERIDAGTIAAEVSRAGAGAGPPSIV